MGDNSLESKYYRILTGHNLDVKELDRCAERAFNLHRAYTARQMQTTDMAFRWADGLAVVLTLGALALPLRHLLLADLRCAATRADWALMTLLVLLPFSGLLARSGLPGYGFWLLLHLVAGHGPSIYVLCPQSVSLLADIAVGAAAQGQSQEGPYLPGCWAAPAAMQPASRGPGRLLDFERRLGL